MANVTRNPEGAPTVFATSGRRCSLFYPFAIQCCSRMRFFPSRWGERVRYN